MVWDAAQDAELRRLAAETHLADAARQMGLRVPKVWAYAYSQKIKALPLRVSREPSYGEWLGKAIQAAQEADISVALVLGRYQCRRASRARWRAWRSLMETYPQYSMAGIARVTGCHHTTIMYGLLRLKELEGAK